MLILRRSARLSKRVLREVESRASRRDIGVDYDPLKPPSKRTKRTLSSETLSTAASSTQLSKDDATNVDTPYLPRTIELRLRADGFTVMGVDEAGRGPLAGPVVAAAAMVPTNIGGIFDSKKITKEDERERLYEEIVASPDVIWAIAVVDAARIDEINILQATLEGMRQAANGVMYPPEDVVAEASIERKGCYVVCSASKSQIKNVKWFALVDGNRLPNEMNCESNSIIKGDSKEYAIAAASILAKVTRDRLMRQYDALYPKYNLAQHKGYPTAAHMAMVREHGASPIHRRTFAPLKHMTFDENGRVVQEE